jgi:hypothetical protein
MAKRGVIDHPKNRRLARQLTTFPGVTLGLLETIWHWVAEFRKDGALTLADLEDALDSGGWLQMFSLDQVATAMTNEAKECVWLDDLGDGRFYIHDWHEHAEDNIHNYLARGHKRFANGEMPSLKRLAKDERIALEAHYKQEDLGSSAQKAHGERTESTLPEPKPEPIAKASKPPSSPQGERPRFIPPDLDACLGYGPQINLPPEECRKFHNYQTAKGWKVGNSPMKDWKAAMVTWRDSPYRARGQPIARDPQTRLAQITGGQLGT